MFFFFFFQAEDGIRDKLVTGVQTCALPILLDQTGSLETSGPEWSLDQFRNPAAVTRGAKRAPQSKFKALVLFRKGLLNPITTATRSVALRSEERRVGKECRCRWSPYQEKKK